MILIIKIRFFVNETNAEEMMPSIIDNMFRAIEYYNNIITNDIVMRDDLTIRLMKNIIENQKRLFTEIKNDITRDARERDDIDFNEFYNINANTLDSRNRQHIIDELNNTEYERRQNEILTRLRERYNEQIRRYDERMQAREAREALRQERQQMLAIARENARTHREANRRARQQGRPQSRTSRRQQQQQQPPTEFIIQPNMIKDVGVDEFDNKVVSGDINDIFKTDVNSIIQRLKTKYNKFKFHGLFNK